MSEAGIVAAGGAPVTPPPIMVEPSAPAPAAPAPEPAAPAFVPPAPEQTLLTGTEAPAAEVPAATPGTGEAASSPAAEPDAPPVETQPEQPAEPTPEAASEAAAEPAAPEPVAYEPFTLPEGMAIGEGDPDMAAFLGLAGEARLSQEQAQKAVDLYTKGIREFAADYETKAHQKQWDTFVATVNDWARESRETFGNKFNTTLNDARWAIAASGTEDEVKQLRDVLNATGTTNHPAIIRAFANLAGRLKEARPPPRPAPTTARSRSPADRRYGRMVES